MPIALEDIQILSNVMEHVLIQNNHSNDYFCYFVVNFGRTKKGNQGSIKVLFIKALIQIILTSCATLSLHLLSFETTDKRKLIQNRPYT